MLGLGAFGTGRAVAAARIDSRIAKAHGHDGDPRFVVECVLVYGQPFA